MSVLRGEFSYRAQLKKDIEVTTDPKQRAWLQREIDKIDGEHRAADRAQERQLALEERINPLNILRRMLGI
ncbi:MAG: hypothetical protein V4437_00615 [Patescibacteria group bacterium]